VTVLFAVAVGVVAEGIVIVVFLTTPVLVLIKALSALDNLTPEDGVLLDEVDGVLATEDLVFVAYYGVLMAGVLFAEDRTLVDCVFGVVASDLEAVIGSFLVFIVGV